MVMIMTDVDIFMRLKKIVFTWSRSDAACAEIRRLDLVLLQYGLGKAALVLLATGAMFACFRVVTRVD